MLLLSLSDRALTRNLAVISAVLRLSYLRAVSQLEASVSQCLFDPSDTRSSTLRILANLFALLFPGEEIAGFLCLS